MVMSPHRNLHSRSLKCLFTFQVNLSLYTTTAVVLLDSDGNRILGKYYGTKNPYPTIKEQKAFKKGLFKKIWRANGEIILYDNQVILYCNSIDIFFTLLDL